MPTKKDLRGQVFGRLVVIAETARTTKTGGVKWLCQCACGNQTTVRSYDLGRVTNSCGCLRQEIVGKQFSKHGQSKSKAYNAWSNITDRCTNPNNKDFHHYGGRGIQVCERWRNSFEAFLLDMGQPPSSKHSIDRIQVDGNYEPSNCRWATQKEQTRNMRKSHMLTWEGKTQCISAWAEELNVPRHLFHSRLKLGWSIEKIFRRIFEDMALTEATQPFLQDLEMFSPNQELDF